MKEIIGEINPGGINGTGTGIVNTNSEDFIALRKAIEAHAAQQTKEEKIAIELLSLKFRMQSYVRGDEDHPDVAASKTAGEYLKEHLKAIGVKNKDFAKYVGLEDSNLSAIINGRRKINVDLALKLGQIFEADSNLWLMVQSKNELIQLVQEDAVSYGRYGLDDLLSKIS
jgi:addiction module HigA family antidote